MIASCGNMIHNSGKWPNEFTTSYYHLIEHKNSINAVFRLSALSAAATVESSSRCRYNQLQLALINKSDSIDHSIIFNSSVFDTFQGSVSNDSSQTKTFFGAKNRTEYNRTIKSESMIDEKPIALRTVITKTNWLLNHWSLDWFIAEES